MHKVPRANSGNCRLQAASSQKLALIEIPQPAAGTRPATLDERAALKLRRMLARGEAERAELWHQVCSSSCRRGSGCSINHD
jgi:hypothetical protein